MLENSSKLAQRPVLSAKLIYVSQPWLFVLVFQNISRTHPRRVLNKIWILFNPVVIYSYPIVIRLNDHPFTGMSDLSNLNESLMSDRQYGSFCKIPVKSEDHYRRQFRSYWIDIGQSDSEPDQV